MNLSVHATADLGAAERAAIVALCERAFQSDFSILFELVERSPESWHVLARTGGALIGHATWYPRRLQVGAVGPFLRARDWEATAVPELRVYARRMADHLLGTLRANLVTRDERPHASGGTTAVHSSNPLETPAFPSSPSLRS